MRRTPNMEQKERISKIEGQMMIFIASGIEIIQLTFGWIPFLGWMFASFMGMLGWATFSLWFTLKGVSPFGNKMNRNLCSAASLLVESAAGFIPFTLTGWVIFMVRQARQEDARRNHRKSAPPLSRAPSYAP